MAGPARLHDPEPGVRPARGGALPDRDAAAEGGEFALAGEFREVDPPRRLAFTFAWDPPDPDDLETLARLSFRDLGEATELALTQGPFKTEERLAIHRDGWTDTLDKLERVLADQTA